MRRFIIERELPDLGNLTAQQLRELSRMSGDVLGQMGPGVQWIHSYITQDRMYCVYLAESEHLLREHARRGGFPCTRVNEVQRIIDLTTAGDDER